MKYAIITGASKGIGWESSLLFAKNGYKVIAIARNINKLNELAKQDSNIEPYQLDISNHEDLIKFNDYIQEKDINILINGASISSDNGNIENLDIDIWNSTYGVNVLGTVFLIKCVIPKMKKNGGTIINITSNGIETYYTSMPSYLSSKSSLQYITKLLQNELNQFPIKVINLSPGNVGYPLTSADIANTMLWCHSIPSHINIDYLSISPLNYYKK